MMGLTLEQGISSGFSATSLISVVFRYWPVRRIGVDGSNRSETDDIPNNGAPTKPSTYRQIMVEMVCLNFEFRITLKGVLNIISDR